MPLPVELLSAVGATTLAARVPRRRLPSDGDVRTGAAAAAIALLVTAAVAVGITASAVRPLHDAYALISLVAVTAAGLTFPYVAFGAPAWLVVTAGGCAGGLYVAGLGAGWLHLVLVACAGLGAACLVSMTFGARGCALLLVILTGSDVIMWQAGILEQFQFAGIGTLQLHPLAAVQLGEFTLGAGDLLASALLGTWACGLGLRLAWRSVITAVQVIGMAGMAAWTVSSAATLPATLPSLAALAAGYVILRAQGEKQTNR